MAVRLKKENTLMRLNQEAEWVHKIVVDSNANTSNYIGMNVVNNYSTDCQSSLLKSN
jgi:hypothetical protein